MDAVRQSYQQEYPRISPACLVGENFSEAMSNSIISSLRAKYLDLTNREADWAARYGADHISVQNIRNQIRDTAPIDLPTSSAGSKKLPRASLRSPRSGNASWKRR